jgi:glycolate oxidase iron-sulfur subunit
VGDDGNIFEGLNVPSEEEYLNCIRCGLCLSACPIYREHLIETQSPRGRIALIRKMVEGELDPSDHLTDQMYQCMACLACNTACPVGIEPADLVLETRTLLEGHKSHWWKRPVFQGVFMRPVAMEIVTLPLRLYQKLGLQKVFHALGLGKALPTQLRDMERMVPDLPDRPLRLELPEVTPAQGGTRYRVGFFLGCVQSLMFADGSLASVEVMSRNGCEVITPRTVTCCGMPPLGYGDMESVKKMVRQNVDLFGKMDVDVIVTDCATCGSTLKDYKEILADDPVYAEPAERFSHKVRDISEFLMEIDVDPPRARLPVRVTYHDPCHLVRAQDVGSQPRDLLKMIPGLEFVEMHEADWCCGSAGTQIITHHENSMALLDRKIQNVADTGAQVVASGCPGCQLQLGLGVKQRDIDVRVVHPIQLLAEAYRNESKPECSLDSEEECEEPEDILVLG